ncbi:MAG: glycogen debranching protein GlgX [Thiolinea sp.]
MALKLQAGSASRMGANFDGEGTNFAVFSAGATKIELCLFSDDGRQELARHTLPERSGAIWHGYAPGLKPGTRYGLRAHGPYAPEQGQRFNANKLLLDPYTRELCGSWQSHPALFAYDTAAGRDDLSFSELDSAPYVPKSVVSDPSFFPLLTSKAPSFQPDLQIQSETLIYEAHVKGLTQEHPAVPENLRGTYEGLASDAMIEHLQKLGITTLELLPVHAFVDEPFLQQRGLSNYWGYNSIAFFTPEPRYFGPSGLIGFRQMTEKLQQAGINVILDVVFNHSAEGDQFGPTLCYRGLDNTSYYRLDTEQPYHYINDTGCGNTLNIAHPYVLKMVMDSLRFWVQCMGVAGFRFDLATTLAREADGFNTNAAFFKALQQDPVLSQATLIAEPWDIGPEGYRLGGFPTEFAEWNDHFRDGVRRFWRGDDYSAQQLSNSLLGTADVFDRGGRRSWASINLLTSHDGFTLTDCTRYTERHNEGNLEDNRDGHHANYSDNCGVEGDSDDPLIIRQRQQRQRNLIATLFLSQGTPMLLGGDEIANSQQGNNNAYCQDNPLGWVNWQQADYDMLSFVQYLSTFRRQHLALRQTHFLHGRIRSCGNPDVSWTDFSGQNIHWDDPQLARLCLLLRCSAAIAPEDCDDQVLLVINRTETSAVVSLPELAPNQCWCIGINTANPDIQYQPVHNSEITIPGESLLALIPAAI